MIEDSKEKEEKGLFDWDIKCINRSDYELHLVFFAHSRLMKHIFNLSKERLKIKKDLHVRQPDSAIDRVNFFPIPKQYFKTLKMAIRKQLRKIKKEIKQDSIDLLKTDIISAEFFRDKDYPEIWQVHIDVWGQYVDRR